MCVGQKTLGRRVLHHVGPGTRLSLLGLVAGTFPLPDPTHFVEWGLEM